MIKNLVKNLLSPTMLAEKRLKTHRILYGPAIEIGLPQKSTHNQQINTDTNWRKKTFLSLAWHFPLLFIEVKP